MPIVTDEQVTDLDHATDRGAHAGETAIEMSDPARAERMHAAREKRAAKKR